MPCINDNEIKEIFAANLKRIMLSRGLNGADLARLIGAEKQSVYAWIKEKSFPSANNIQELVNALGVSSDELLTKRYVMDIGENIKRLRLDADLTQSQLADKVGVTRATVTQWETGWSQPRMGMVEKLANELGVPITSIVAGPRSSSSDGFVDVPLYGSIAAGTPIEMLPVNDTHPIPIAVRDKYPTSFLLKIKGSSMDKVLPDGCYALIDPCQEVERDGKPYAVCVNGFDATVKRVRKLANGFQLIPDSTDPTYETVTYNYNEPGAEEITVMGRVVFYVIPFDWEF